MFYIVFTEDRYVELKHFIHNICILLFYIFFLFIRMCVCNIYFLEMRYSQTITRAAHFKLYRRVNLWRLP